MIAPEVKPIRTFLRFDEELAWDDTIPDDQLSGSYYTGVEQGEIEELPLSDALEELEKDVIS